MQTIRSRFGINAPERGGRLDPLLIAARILLYVLLAGTALALFMGVVGAISTISGQADARSTASIEPVWRTLAGSLIGLIALGLIIRIVLRLLAMIATVDQGMALLEANADRLRAIARMMLGLQVLGLLGRLVGAPIRGDINGFNVAFDVTPGGIAVVLLMFILARVFRVGSEMREELEGTV